MRIIHSVCVEICKYLLCMTADTSHCHLCSLVGKQMLWNEMSQAEASHQELQITLRAGKYVNNLITSTGCSNGCSRLESPFVSSLLKSIRQSIYRFFCLIFFKY